MGLLAAIRTHVGGADAITECRHCGKNVSHETDSCPACESTEIAHYRC